MGGRDQTRTYSRKDSVVFRKTDEPFGGLSNMAGGYPIHVNGVRVLTSEALYQVCRFPHLPDVQKLIIAQVSPMTAKMRSKPYRKDSRADWDHVRVRIMRWSLRMKLANNWNTFSALLLKTGERPIVEESRKDDFWGAKVVEDGDTLVGMNVLGRLLMELREQVKQQGRDAALDVAPPDIPQFLLFGRPIEVAAGSPPPPQAADAQEQASLFGAGALVSVEDPAPAAVTGAYPSYRSSGLPWVPRVPDGWQVLRNGRLFGHRVETGFPDLPILEVSLRTGVRVRDMENGKRKQVMSQRENYKRAVKNDLAYNMMRMWQGAVGPAPVDGLVSPAYVVVKPYPEANSAYFTYLFRTAAYMREVNKFSRGIVADRNRLYWEAFKQMPSLVPPRPEQDQIVAYLRAQDAHIARFIKAKRDLIALLTEQKLRIIDHAVTRGLDSSVKLKPSGIEWLGAVPEHWELRRLKFFASNVTNQTTTKASDEIYLALEHVESWTGAARPLEGEVDFASTVKRFVADDVLFGKLRPYLAKVTRAVRAGVCVSEFLVLRSRKELVRPAYLEQLLRCKRVIDLINSSTAGAKMPRADWTFIGNARLPVPPVGEQQEILLFIASETKDLDETIARAHEEIALIREYRDRLIADAVTGQVDLRGWQPGPDDAVSDDDLAALGDDDAEPTEEDADGEEN
jgi:type I restriction enzyme S subunit